MHTSTTARRGNDSKKESKSLHKSGRFNFGNARFLLKKGLRAAHIKSTYHYLATQHKLLLALIPLLVLVAGIVVHELIHGLTWALFARNGRRSIKYGVLWKYVTPYCHCNEPLEVRHYVLGALMPAVILGILPSIAGIITGNFYVLVTGIFFVMAAAGDFMIIYLLRGEKRSNRVLDHPNEAGCYIYRQG
ncbi:DUF3267 domain-containing protein [Niabella hirudinis]|uniref:DUF3267 domain-containing protein n=1 Tax=Niabella hirudinis TaxID=1285929 RepID=UPI003EBFD0F9